jgi:methylenetetrahydrofolate reductase (NADPH)
LVESEGHLEEVMGRLSGANIRRAFVIGGDVGEPAGPYAGSLELVTAIRERDGALELGAAGYPEGHPYIDDETLMADLLEKQRYVGYITTQLCFDANRILEWIARVRERGVHLPVEAGMPGILDRRKLLELSLKIGVGESTRFLKKNTGVAARLALPGGYEPTELVSELGPYLGDPYYNLAGFHIYTFNHLQRTEEWRKGLLQKEELSTGEMQGASR